MTAYWGDVSGANAVFTITGSNVTTGGRDLLLRPKTGATSLLSFVADRAGVSAMNSTFKMEISNTGFGSTNLAVDLSALAPGTGTLTLANYGSVLVGTFGLANIPYGATTLSAGILGSLGNNEYAIDYGDRRDGSITLQYNVIPEPSTLALFGLAGVAVVIGLRRTRGGAIPHVRPLRIRFPPGAFCMCRNGTGSGNLNQREGNA